MYVIGADSLDNSVRQSPKERDLRLRWCPESLHLLVRLELMVDAKHVGRSL